MFRNLDGVFFEIEREGKRNRICFSDLVEEEKDMVLKNASKEWLSDMCKYLAKVIIDIGNQLDIRGEVPEDINEMTPEISETLAEDLKKVSDAVKKAGEEMDILVDRLDEERTVDAGKLAEDMNRYQSQSNEQIEEDHN